MLLSLEWLSDFIDLNDKPAKIADMLTMSGCEVESIEDIEQTVVFDLNITPNRSDCLSVAGIARELAAITKVPLKGHVPYNIQDERALNVAVEIQSPQLCYRYTGRVITGVQVSESPQWLKDRLRRSGVRSINNVVDITNYVMLERGQPLHAFDLSTISGKCISARALSRDVKIITLDGVERAISRGTLMICDKKGPIAVAGVMGGLHTEVTETTTNIFLESACFNHASIRKTSKALNLSSESSYRFERGVDIESVPVALNRAAMLIQEICGGDISKIIDVYPERFIPREISLTTEKLSRILGIDIGQDDVEDIFKRLCFDVKKENGRFIVTPPLYRGDIEIDADLIEEVARLYGYENIPAKLPDTQFAVIKKSKRVENIDLLKNALRYAGFTEVINYSFVSKDALNILSNSQQANCIVVKNPLRSDQSLLRTSIVSSLIQNFLYNLNHGMPDVSIYEIGTVFFNKGENLPDERLKLAALSYYSDVKRLWREPANLFFQTKGLVQSILDELSITQYTLRPSKEPFLMQDLSLDIWLDGLEEKCGFMGMLSPDVIKKMDIKTSSSEVAVLELYVDVLFSDDTKIRRYTPLPKYPAIERDISLVVDNSTQALSIIELIQAYPDKLIESVEIFDYYRGANLPEGKKSLAFHVRYRAIGRTLTEQEIDTLHNSIVKHVMEITGGSLR
ncbi:MAG: phenylalanine--tRNA ligase subunit beta [Nitrospirae bacterium]|nr:phenylalanine--tRNA ligase subunit beta [Nitrospirota bacterium]